jgi:tetratricopeptide (TPR) repeat protein
MEYYNSLLPPPPDEPKLDEIFAYYYNLKGASKADEGNYREALENFSKALDFNPEFSVALFNRATIKADIGDLKGAREDFIKMQVIESKRIEEPQENSTGKLYNEKLKNRINIF